MQKSGCYRRKIANTETIISQYLNMKNATFIFHMQEGFTSLVLTCLAQFKIFFQLGFRSTGYCQETYPQKSEFVSVIRA